MKTAPADFDQAKDRMASDLVAFFMVMQHKAIKLLDTAIKEGWTPAKLIEEVEKIDKQKAED